MRLPSRLPLIVIGVVSGSGIAISVVTLTLVTPSYSDTRSIAVRALVMAVVAAAFVLIAIERRRRALTLIVALARSIAASAQNRSDPRAEDWAARGWRIDFDMLLRAGAYREAIELQGYAIEAASALGLPPPTSGYSKSILRPD